MWNMEVFKSFVTSQYGNNKYENSTIKSSTILREQYHFHISRLIVIILMSVLLTLTIWNSICISQLKIHLQMHALTVQELRYEAIIYQKAIEKLNKQLGIPSEDSLFDHGVKNHNSKNFTDQENGEKIVKSDNAEGQKHQDKQTNSSLNDGYRKSINSGLFLKSLQDYALNENYSMDQNKKLKRIARSHKLFSDMEHDHEAGRVFERYSSLSKRSVTTTKKIKNSTDVNKSSSCNKPAAHFHLHRKVADANTAFRINRYDGDMYIGHASWTNEINIADDFQIENGILTVHQPGLYYVYAQVCYENTHDHNGFVIFHGHKPFLQCLNTVPTNISKIHTCHTSGLIYLKPDEKLHLRDLNRNRNVILRESNNRSYFGLIKI